MTGGWLTTHVLDTYRGRAGAGMSVTLTRDGEELARITTNADGRTDQPLLEGEAFRLGTYELHFDVGSYFKGVAGVPDPPFLTVVTVRFSLLADEHYHVPLVASPWTYTTYRGS
jgi:hydroxyisourate hydrolase